MAKKTKILKISFEVSQGEFDIIYEELFKEIMDGFAYECGDDSKENYIQSLDRAKNYFENKTPSVIIKEYIFGRVR